MSTDRPLFGILLMSAFCLLAPMGDSIAKLLGGSVPVLQIVIIRFAIQTALLMPVVLITRRDLRMGQRMLLLLFLRSVLHIIGIGAMFLSLIWLPLTDAIAIAFVEPFLLMLLAWWILKEEIGRHRIMACGLGFIGTLLVIQPSFTEVGMVALLPLVVALAFAFFILTTRQLATRSDPITLQAVSGAMALAVLGLILWLFGDSHSAMTLIRPSHTDWALLLLLGVIGTAAHLLMTWSLRYAPTAVLAPVQYLEIPFAAMIGWLVFRDFPDGLALLGIAITVAAGLYVIQRERKAARPHPSAP